MCLRDSGRSDCIDGFFGEAGALSGALQMCASVCGLKRMQLTAAIAAHGSIDFGSGRDIAGSAAHFGARLRSHTSSARPSTMTPMISQPGPSDNGVSAIAAKAKTAPLPARAKPPIDQNARELIAIDPVIDFGHHLGPGESNSARVCPRLRRSAGDSLDGCSSPAGHSRSAVSASALFLAALAAPVADSPNPDLTRNQSEPITAAPARATPGSCDQLRVSSINSSGSFRGGTLAASRSLRRLCAHNRHSRRAALGPSAVSPTSFETLPSASLDRSIPAEAARLVGARSAIFSPPRDCSRTLSCALGRG